MFYILGGVYLITAILVTFFIPMSNVPQIKGSMLDSFKQYSFVGMYTTLGSYLSGTFGLNSQDILYVRCVGIIGMLVSPFSRTLVTKFGIHPVIRVGLSLAVLGLAILGISSS